LGTAGLVASYLRVPPLQEEPVRPREIPASQPAPRSVTRDRVDLYGDPLPEGALARLGSLKFNHGSPINSVAFTPNGRFLGSVGGGDVRLWEPLTGREVRQVGSPRDALRSMAFSPDSKMM